MVIPRTARYEAIKSSYKIYIPVVRHCFKSTVVRKKQVGSRSGFAMKLPDPDPTKKVWIHNTGCLKGTDLIMMGGLLPSSSIWPSRQEICIVFTVLPCTEHTYSGSP